MVLIPGESVVLVSPSAVHQNFVVAGVDVFVVIIVVFHNKGIEHVDVVHPVHAEVVGRECRTARASAQQGLAQLPPFLDDVARTIVEVCLPDQCWRG